MRRVRIRLWVHNLSRLFSIRYVKFVALGQILQGWDRVLG